MDVSGTQLTSSELLPVDGDSQEALCSKFLETLARDHQLLCAKTHRIDLPTGLPMIPCLDHEAQLTGQPPPHISLYIEDAEGDLHEVGFIPSERRIVLDVPSTLAETSPAAVRRIMGRLISLFPDDRVDAMSPSIVKGDRRVARVVGSQLHLRDVLCGEDGPSIRWSLEKIRAIAEFMEKESRVYSWAVRTMTPVIGGAGIATYFIIGLFKSTLGSDGMEMLRAATATVLSAVFLYLGMKAVYLTQLGTRVWKRATEYKLILDARRGAQKPLRLVGTDSGRGP